MNNNGGGNSKTIDDLDNDMLTQILFRLPSCAPVVACKLVNKRWCSLISDPKFAVQFCNHKKESTTLSEPGSDIEDDEPPWAFIANTTGIRFTQNNQHCAVNTSSNEAVFGFPISLGFFPHDFFIEATFMDLVLCSGHMTSEGSDRGGRIYYITNPLTKQWVALPPCPGIFDPFRAYPWVGLVCQQPYDYTQDYKFRVVLINHRSAPVYELRVYCSEIGEWKKFNLTVSINPELAAQRRLHKNEFQGVVCNGIFYFLERLYVIAFNPFDVDETTDNTTIEAKVLPSLPNPVSCFLQESSGQLYIMHNPVKDCFLYYTQHGKAIEFPLVLWKLDPNQVPLIWTTTFEGLCTGNLNEIEDDELPRVSLAKFGMHPNNDKLIYIDLWREQRLVLCDIRTKLIKPLISLPGYRFKTLRRLELQWWPTSVPKAYFPNASPR